MYKQILIVFLLLLGGQTLSASLQCAYPQIPGNISEQAVPADIRISHGNSVHTAYKDVFWQFGDNAERLYQQYGVFALEFLKEYKIEGLALLEKHGREMANLHPLLDYRDIFHLYSNPDNNINNLNIFSPKTLSQFYKTFGDEGIKYITNSPENFFLINEDKDKGVELMNLANEKGDIVFPLARKHGIAFARLYDKDVLNIVIKFQEDGLLAVKEFGEKAKILFHLFIDDDIFYHVIKTYGHKQTIPIIYLFYDNEDFNSQVYDYLKKTKVYEWVSSWWYGTDTSAPNTQSDAVIRRENARRAVNLIFELGNDFLDRFEILDINNVKEESITTITNKLRNFFISDVEKVSRKRIRQEDITFQDKLFAGLDILGFVPIGGGISKGAKFAAKGARFAKTAKGFKGLINLTEDLVKTYGDDVVQFVAKYGDDGIKALKATDGKILKISQQYGDDAVRYVSKYGADAGTAIEKYGNDVLSLARQYGDDVIKYTALYGDDGLRIIQKHGKDVVLLSSVYGDNVIKMAALHGDDVISYVSKYGSRGIEVIEKYGDDVIRLAKRHGDDVVKYVGMYGDDGLKLARKGKIGLFVMRFMPPKAFAKCAKFAKYGLIASIFLIIATHPIAFLSGLIHALAWLFGASPIIIAIILGLVATFFLIRFLRKFTWFFTPFLVCFRILKKFVVGN
ncbi:MAG: hypothetical protein HZA47_09780 [Planctomycetes bacterium]|uniref:hypothetical protein n=1 Tax=Candidatus Wunengus sp. YC65 TaxID=3367701 RepID=UPI001D7CE38D|nr:hypothetical protein [Planctomycetota bacterium]